METPSTTPLRQVKVSRGFEQIAWKWMRYSGFLIIPLAFFHILLQDVIVGVHGIDLDYVAKRLSMLGWRIYDALLLTFAFAHGVNGLRQILIDFVHHPHRQKLINIILLAFWAIVSALGAVALIAGVRPG
jgi:succinate dehydrogenase / fumarate reductase membrane anchor subunit